MGVSVVPATVPHPQFDAAALSRCLPDLVLLPQWVCWRFDWRTSAQGEPKLTKIPLSAQTGYEAKSTDPATWATFGQAVAAAQRRGWGIGFVFAAAGGVFGVDLDKCRDKDTGALAAWAADVVRALDSYTEVTPSATGLHLIGRGQLPPGRRRTGAIEMYDSGRFFTMTGQHLDGTPPRVQERGREIAALHAQTFAQVAAEAGAARSHTDRAWTVPAAPPADLRERAAQGRIRRSTLALLDCAGAQGYTSASEADAALAAGLMSASLTEDETLCLIVASARGQDALGRKGTRHGLDYLQRTVRHAAAFLGPVIDRPEGLRLRFAGSGLPLRLATCTPEAPVWPR
jgi:primase-polymerase (primpol)-like protein